MEKWIGEFETSNKFKLEDKQREATIQAMTQPVSITNGKAGTGKTTTANAVIYCCKAENGKTLGIASTGKAARNFTSRTDLPAITMHKFCAKPTKYLKNVQPESLTLFVDEVGMSDLITARRFFAILSTGVRVILYGDVNQLPSVEAGRVLADFIESEVVPLTTLDVVKRQSGTSQIVSIANSVLEGDTTVRVQDYKCKHEAAMLDDLFGDLLPEQEDTDNLEEDDLIDALVESVVPATTLEPEDVQFVRELQGAEIETKILELVQSDLTELTGVWIEEKDGQKRKIERNDIQILSLQRTNYAGTHRLNVLLQAARHGQPTPELNLNPKERQVTNLMVGDRVVITKNDEDRDVANGDIGTVVTIDTVNSFKIVVEKEEKGRKSTKVVEYSATEINNHVELAYALTIHKSQGSEYPVVIIPVTKFHMRMLTQNMLYTALTRSKQLVLLVGSSRAWKDAISTPAPHRNSTLSSRIRSAHKEAVRRFTRA